MDILFALDTDLLNKNICRCCLKSGLCKDISVECYEFGEKEIYEDLLKDTFNLQISQNFPENIITRRLICFSCITRLREAFAFKKMVVTNEKMLMEYLDRMRCTGDRLGEVDIKTGDVKVETDFDTSHIEEDLDVDVLENLKEEKCTPEDCIIENKHKKRRKSQVTTAGGCKMADIVEEKNSSNTHMKTERRGKAPVLRDNSLKLLANSTICVFQWNKSRYRCFCCTEPFNDMHVLRQHTDAKHSLADIEKKIINQQNRLVKVDISLIKCKLCKEIPSSLDNLRIHLTNAHNIKLKSTEHLLVPFKIQDGDLSCQICHENFNLFRVLNIHMNKHYKKHICDTCGASFSNLVFLHLHKTRQHRPLRCGSCNLTFLSRLDKRNHDVKVHELKRERKRFPCQYCSERFLQESLKILHLVEKHNLKKPEHKCSYCCKLFITKSLVNNHIKYVHLKEKVHECDVCKSSFYTRSDLRRHKGTHGGVKKFACAACSSVLASKDSLRRHLRRAHSE